MSDDRDTIRTTDDRRRLESLLRSIDGSGYGGYKRLRGEYRLGACLISMDRVQVDPFAPPSLIRLSVSRETAAIPVDLVDDRVGTIAVEDFLTRAVAALLRGGHVGDCRAVSIGTPGQAVLERTSIAITDQVVEARLSVALPANGRRIRGREAARILTRALPAVAEQSLEARNLDADALRSHVALLRDQESLRSQLSDRGLVAFVGDGAILPRRAGDSDLPLEHGVTPFQSPRSLRTEIPLPSGRTAVGMGIGEGITLIVGGGYHGKSTLLRAIERGVCPHIAGDGREWVVTRPDAVAVRAEDGRAVTDVDISPFIADLPSGKDTRRFSTTNASGSTSQAANLVEAIGAGASALLIDEDTSATNFMIRDVRMRELIPADREPITPFVDRIGPLREELGVSTVLVAGGSGAFFDVAERVIAMDAYVPRDVTEKAREIAAATPQDAEMPRGPASRVFGGAAPRIPAAGALAPQGKRKPASARGKSLIRFGTDTIDLSAVSQLIASTQTEGVAHALDRLSTMLDGSIALDAAVQELEARIDADGLDVLSPYRGHPGRYARPRGIEIAAAVNRYRGLRMRD